MAPPADEEPVPLPSAPLVTLSPNAVLQPPLSRRGTGPGVVLFLPNAVSSVETKALLDPEPVSKWAEEGFAVVGITVSESLSIDQHLQQALDALQALDQVDIKQKFAVIVYDPRFIRTISDAITKHPRVAAFVGYGSFPSPNCPLPILLHLTANAPRPAHPPTELTTQHTYDTTSAAFVLPQTAKYDPTSAALAHTRTLVFLRKHLGGPFFDLEAIYDEHTYFEFEARSVAQTMATMVAEPYVNHVPTMTGGVGRENVAAFYRDHVISSNPADTRLQTISRTVGSDRIVDELIFHATHDRTIDAILPGVPPTGNKLAIPMVAIVCVRGDRLYSEHIWSDQGTALRQAGILPSHLPFVDPQAPEGTPPAMLRLPVAGVESANMLIDPSKGKSNEMLGPEWGISKTSGTKA